MQNQCLELSYVEFFGVWLQMIHTLLLMHGYIPTLN